MNLIDVPNSIHANLSVHYIGGYKRARSAITRSVEPFLSSSQAHTSNQSTQASLRSARELNGAADSTA